MRSGVTSAAFPGLPVIFAEGYRRGRVSMHGHISLALTSADGSVRTETSVEEAGENVFLVNGLELGGLRGKGMLAVRDALLERAGGGIRVKISSTNCGLLSGSSDSGAAALAVALDRFLGLNLSIDGLHEVARSGSETAYRSLYGGLSEYYFLDGLPAARNLLPPSELGDLVVYAVPFDYLRHKADDLHLSVVKHPHYARRMADVESRIKEFKGALAERELVRCLQLMEDDARQVHKMFEEVGCRVLKGKMVELCGSVERWRAGGLTCFWNVAGASVVYVFTTKRESRVVSERLAGYDAVEYKVAGHSKVIL